FGGMGGYAYLPLDAVGGADLTEKDGLVAAAHAASLVFVSFSRWMRGCKSAREPLLPPCDCPAETLNTRGAIHGPGPEQPRRHQTMGGSARWLPDADGRAGRDQQPHAAATDLRAARA